VAAFGFSTDLLADAVVGIAAEARLSASEVLQVALGALGAPLLQRRPQGAHLLARVLDGGTAAGLTVASRR
jgi:hypothetical protein